MRRFCVSSLIVIAVVIACGRKSTQTTKSAPYPQPPADGFTRPAHPLAMPVAVDAPRAVKANISTDGGIIEATAQDGTKFTLTIPRDALLFDTTIMLTPVASIEGKSVGFAGPAAAVQLGPDGLRLFKPAKLLIEPARAIPLKDQAAVGWASSGDDFHLEPLDLGTPHLSIELMHFSGAGVGLVQVDESGYYAPDSIPWENITPQDAENRLREYLGELINSQRQAQLQDQPGDPEFHQKVEQVFQMYYETVIKGLMAEALGNCEKASDDVPRILSFGHNAELLGVAADKTANLGTFLLQVLENCWANEVDRCLVAGDGARVARIVSLARQLQLLGGSESPDEIVPCETVWGGTFTAKEHPGALGIPASRTAQVTFKLDKIWPNGTQHYVSVSPSVVTWQASGTWPDGCVLDGSGTYPARAGDGFLDIIPADGGLSYNGHGASNGSAPVTVTCPDGGTTVVPYGGAGPWFVMDSSSPVHFDDPKRIKGSFVLSAPPPSYNADFSWTMTRTP